MSVFEYKKARYTGLVFTVFFLTLCVYQGVLAYNDSDTETETVVVCDPLYIGVEKVNFYINSDVPNLSKIDVQGKFENALDRFYRPYMEEHGVKVAYMSSENTNEQSHNELKVSIFLSYVNKASFTIPVAKDLLAVWSKSNVVRTKKRERILDVKQVSLPFLKIDGSSRLEAKTEENYFPIEIDEDIDIRYLDSVFRRDISRALCSVLNNNHGLKCENPNSFSKSKMEKLDSACKSDFN